MAHRPRIVALAGTEASVAVVRALPLRTGTAIVVAARDGDLIEALRSEAGWPVVVVDGALELRADHCHVVPPHHAVRFAGDRLRLAACGPIARPVDQLFRAVAAEAGPSAIAIVVDGAPGDGSAGLLRLREAGGVVIALAPGTDDPRSLAGIAAGSGLADLVLTLDELPDRLRALGAAPLALADEAPALAGALAELAALARDRLGVELGGYRGELLAQRLARRMRLAADLTLADYLQRLRERRDELARLVADVHAPWSAFFRDPEAFDGLATRVLPGLFAGRSEPPPVIWVPACATGEEAYTLAMLCAEQAPEHPVRVLATDLDAGALARAERGVYPPSIEAAVCPSRLARFFERHPDGYRVGDALRARVSFAAHDVRAGAPVHDAELVSCRNLLRDLDPDGRARVLAVCAGALRPGGHLLLGADEELGARDPHFAATAPAHQVYLRRPDGLAPPPIDDQVVQVALRAAPMFVAGQDAGLRYAWGYLLGAPIEFVGGTDDDAFGPAIAARLTALKRDVLASATARRAELELAVAGVARTFDLRFEPFTDAHDAPGVATIGIDVTAYKVAERALRAADRRKDEFLATLSHELRNPLTPLRAALDLQKYAGDDPDRVEKSREMMERQVDQLTQLVEDLLDLSRITQNKITLNQRRVPLQRVVDGAIEAIQPLIDRYGHVLTVRVPDELITVRGDLTRLTQILVNLLTNACKFTPAGGRITVEVEVDRARAVAVTRVVDSGVGIAADVMPHLFEIFVQSRETLARSPSGLGIGLNLVRRLTELHGGTVRADSEGVGRGSTFTVELPLVEPEN